MTFRDLATSHESVGDAERDHARTALTNGRSGGGRGARGRTGIPLTNEKPGEIKSPGDRWIRTAGGGHTN